MWLSDTSVKRPVFATVINLLLIVFGLFSLLSMSVREYPNVDPPVVSVRTNYLGASAAVVETQITQIIEDQIAGIEGIKSISSSSRDGSSNITVEFQLTRDIDAAANDIRDRVSRVLNNLPDQADPPEVVKADSDANPIMWLVLTSPRMNNLELSDYADRYIADRFATVDGVSQIRLGGDRRYAMRIWLDRLQLAARGLTVEDIETALNQQNIERPAGRIESAEREFSLRTTRAFRTPEDFAQLVLRRSSDGFPVRLGEVARIELGAENPRGSFRANGVPSLGLGIIKTSTANTLAVAQGVRAEMQRLLPGLPEGMKLELNYDSSEFISSALQEVVMTLLYAAVFVIAVIYLFLGSARATLIPAVTVPISLLASFIFLYAFGFSVNILTLLALVLAIGLVVDDAIVMVENIHRRLELGEPPLLAAYRGAREVGFAIVATTIVLVAVFTPLAFLDGNVGRLFREFALAMAAAVACSSIVALTLAPVLAAWLLKKHDGHNRFSGWLDLAFDRLERRYRRSLGAVVERPVFSALALLGLGAGVALLFQQIDKEFAPFEDRGGFFVRLNAPEGASVDYTQRQLDLIEQPLMARVGEEVERVLLRLPGFGGGDDVNTGIAIVTLKHWSQRERNSEQVAQDISAEIGDLPGARAFITQRSGFGVRFGQPVQVAIGGGTYEELAQWRDRVMARAQQNPGLQRLDSDYRETKPQIELSVDISRAADLGVPVSSVARALETFMGGRRVTTFQQQGEEYDIIIQAPDRERRAPDDLSDIYVRSATDGALIPLSNLMTRNEKAAAASLNRLNRLRTITISANLAPGYTLGEALEFMERVVREELPENAQLSYTGESREFKESGQALFLTFAMALLIVYLVLAAQFESFVHPLAIMTTVPLAVFGSLGALWLLGMTLNIYSQIGVVMLIGLAAKNGILIVEFANQQRDAGKEFLDALLTASAIRLRPILMTSISTLAGAMPLILASGAGSEARQILGVVIFFGVAFATLFTLYVVPSFYALICRRTHSPEHVAHQLADLQQTAPDRAG
ncbi:MAG: efflux RND transporter permease subunit [Gammaproteobacteria bacterium]